MIRRSVLVTIAAVSLGTVFLSAARAEAATFYVSTAGNDNNPGSLQAPFRTISRGLGRVVAGDTLYIRSGTYRERVFEVDLGGGGSSWSSPVTVAAYPGDAVTLTVAPGGDNVVRFQDGSAAYVVIDGITLDGSGGGNMSTLVYLGASSHHIRLQNLEIRNAQNNGVLAEGRLHEFINLHVHHTGLWDGYNAGSNGMYLQTDDSVVAGGDYHDNECYGIRFMDSSTAASSDNNTIRGARIHSNGYRKAWGGASQCASDGGGIVLSDNNNGAYNNLLYNNHIGVMVYTASKRAAGTRVTNNTVYGNTVGISIFAGSTATQALNNIVYANGSNIVNSASDSSLSHNLTTDPSFVNTSGDFRLRAGSQAIDAGVAAGVASDFNGVSRPTGAGTDIGAFEFVGTSGPSSLPAPPRNVRIVQ